MDIPLPERICYRVAKDALATAEYQEQLRQEIVRINSLKRKETDPIELERLRVEWTQVSAQRGGFTEATYTAFVFSALCLEVFINQQLERLVQKRITSSNRLSDNDRDFLRDELRGKWLRLSADRKWRDFPRLMGKTKTFDTNTEPYQAYKELLKLRNTRLVHYAPHRETRVNSGQHPEVYPDRLTDILIDVDLTRKYFELIEVMVNELNSLTDGFTPAFDLDQGGVAFIQSSLRGSSTWTALQP